MVVVVEEEKLQGFAKPEQRMVEEERGRPGLDEGVKWPATPSPLYIGGLVGWGGPHFPYRVRGRRPSGGKREIFNPKLIPP